MPRITSKNLIRCNFVFLHSLLGIFCTLEAGIAKCNSRALRRMLLQHHLLRGCGNLWCHCGNYLANQNRLHRQAPQWNVAHACGNSWICHTWGRPYHRILKFGLRVHFLLSINLCFYLPRYSTCKAYLLDKLENPHTLCTCKLSLYPPLRKLE